MNDNVIFVDTETTGLDPDRHEVWDIALIEDDGTEHEWHIRPAHPDRADPGALRITNFYSRTAAKEWRWLEQIGPDKPRDAYSAASEIALLTANKHLVGAVPWFDAAFLSKFLLTRGQREAWHYHMIDVETLAVGWLAGGAGRLWSPEKAEPPRETYQPPWNSNGLSLTLGVKTPDEDRHTAIGDARWAKAIYEKVMG